MMSRRNITLDEESIGMLDKLYDAKGMNRSEAVRFALKELQKDLMQPLTVVASNEAVIIEHGKKDPDHPSVLFSPALNDKGNPICRFESGDEQLTVIEILPGRNLVERCLEVMLEPKKELYADLKHIVHVNLSHSLHGYLIDNCVVISPDGVIRMASVSFGNRMDSPIGIGDLVVLWCECELNEKQYRVCCCVRYTGQEFEITTYIVGVANWVRL